MNNSEETKASDEMQLLAIEAGTQLFLGISEDAFIEIIENKDQAIPKVKGIFNLLQNEKAEFGEDSLLLAAAFLDPVQREVLALLISITVKNQDLSNTFGIKSVYAVFSEIKRLNEKHAKAYEPLINKEAYRCLSGVINTLTEVDEMGLHKGAANRLVELGIVECIDYGTGKIYDGYFEKLMRSYSLRELGDIYAPVNRCISSIRLINPQLRDYLAFIVAVKLKSPLIFKLPERNIAWVMRVLKLAIS